MLISEKKLEGYQWTGEKIDVTPALDASLGLVDILVRVWTITGLTKS